jgi:hypothetical protein
MIMDNIACFKSRSRRFATIFLCAWATLDSGANGAAAQAPAQAPKVAGAPAVGVVIDEKAVAQILYVSPRGSDTHAGSADRPFATIQKAVDAAGNKATKIVLEDGVYRHYVEVPRGDNLLIFEARNTGKAIISGADVATAWKALGRQPWSLHARVEPQVGA